MFMGSVLSIEPDGLRLTPLVMGKTASAHELNRCPSDGGSPMSQENVDQAR